MKSTTWVCKSLAVLTGVFVASLAGLPASAQVSNSAASAVTVAVPARVTQAVDNSKLVPLKGGVSPLAQAQFDRGAVAPGFAPGHLLLLLQRSGEQQAALHKLMFSQIDRASPNFHAWLTPEQFGTRFGPADSDVQAVTSWMQSQGLQVFGVNKGKSAVEFTGTAAALQKAFHSPIHQFAMNGKTYWSNTSALQIPAALAPVIRGVRLNNLSAPRPLHHVAGAFSKSLDTGRIQALNTAAVTHSSPCTGAAGSSCFAIGPADFATIYNVLPLWNGTAPATARIDGTGQSIAVLGTSNISLSDVANFRTLFGLPTAGAAVPQVVIDGEDPGIVNDQGQETEALTDVEWAGAVAKNAQIHLVVAIPSNDHSSGIELAALRVVDNNSDPIIEISFSDCEANNDTVMQDLEVFWEQAAAQGITVVAAAGDAGSPGCSDPSQPAPNPATQGLQVNGIASTPFNIAVGGTDFNDAGAQATYFNAVATPGAAASAKSYIPETTWNDSCTNAVFGADPEANCNSTTPPANAAIVTLGSGGGLSTLFTEPDFQAFISAANGMPGGARALPDVSLFAGDGFPGAPAGQSSGSFYVLCQADSPLITSAASSCQGATPQFVGVGGTSVSSAAFAGIMALVNQQQGGRQGNANFVLYKLAQLQFTAGAACTSQASPLPDATCVFNDIATGTNAQPCASASLNCVTNNGADANGVLSGFSAGAGYDAATGLGSVNAANLVTQWQNGLTAFIPTQTTLQLNAQSAALNGITVGDFVSVDVTVTPSSGTVAPTGDVGLVSTASTEAGVDGPGVNGNFTLTPSGANGVLVGAATDQLTGNNGAAYQVTAHYAGDGVFAPSDSNAVTVGGAAKTASSASAFLLNTDLSRFPILNVPPISPSSVILTALIGGNNPTNVGGGPPPTGTVDFLDNGTVVAAAVPLNQGGEAFHATPVIFTAGNHSIVAHYNGDASYNPSDSTAVPFTVAAPAFNMTASPATITAGNTGPSVITITPTNAFTGTVAVNCGSLPPGVTCAPANINVTNGAVATGNLNLTVAGPSTTLTASAFPARSESLPAHRSGWMFASATTGFFAVLLLFLPGRKRLRAILSLGLVSLLSLAIGCNSSSNQNSGPAASTTKLTVTSSKVPSTNANGFQVTVNVTGGSVTPSGQVQIFDQTTNTTAPPVALTNGSANINLTLTVGTHTVIAQYLGDSKHNTSQSGALSLTTTGTAQITITANPVANGPASVALTIN